MSLLAWNCRGLGSASAVRSLTDEVKDTDPVLVFLSETKANRNRVKGIQRKLNFTQGIIVPSDGWGGGLAMLWKEGADVSFKSYSNAHIDVVVCEGVGAQPWRAMGFYGHPDAEYGMGGEASTEGDVYSYGVLVLEMFTGRMPTNDMLKDGLNLHNFVKMALPKRLAQVVDPILLPREVEELGVATAVMMATEKDDNDNEIEAEEANNIEDSRHIDVDMQKCLLSILNIGILCSLESPKERMSMEEVIKELQLIKSAFISLGIRKGKPNRAQRHEANRRN